MNKSMLVGLVGGIGVATAGGVLGYQFLGEPSAEVAVEVEAPAPAAAPARTSATPAARTAAAAAPVEECWDEEVQVTADPKDQNRIAGTAIGAVVGGAGALIGRKIQERVQENRADQRTTTTVERRCGPPGSAPR